jgi:hypothetical protein
LLVVGLLVAGGGWWIRTSDGPVAVDAAGDQVQTVARGRLPAFAAGGDIAELYRFAVAHGAWLSWIPCTCGCREDGHASTRACYVTDESRGRVTFTSRALSCARCLDITRAVMRLQQEGRTLEETRREIDRRYLALGRPAPARRP